MKKIIVMLTLVGIIRVGFSKGPESGEGVQFFHGSWKEALEKAKKENKNLFVDFYADWCGPCKWMTREVFVKPELGEYFNSNLIAVKINAEKEEHELVGLTKISAYPTLAVFDPTGAVLARTEGAVDAEELLKFIRSVKDFSQVEADYRSDSMSFSKFESYVNLLAYRDRTLVSAEVTRFLDRLPLDSLKTDAAWQIIVSRFEDYNSKTFQTLCENAKWFKENQSNFEETYGWFLNAMLAKAGQENDSLLVEKMKDDYITIRKSVGTMKFKEAYYRQAIDLAYRKQVQDSAYCAGVLDAVSKYYARDWKVMGANVLDVLQSGIASTSDMERCLVFAKKALTLSNNSFTNYVLAAAYEANRSKAGNQDKAKVWLIQALTKAKTDQINLNGGGYTTVGYEESDQTIVAIVNKLL